jgi:N-acylglucosamine-6-phosphate 2-epimerase
VTGDPVEVGAALADLGFTSTRGLPPGIIVSCQAAPGDPLDESVLMTAMAKAAAAGGAIGIRANGPDDIRAIRAAVRLPIIGLYKDDLRGFAVRITPTREHARAVASAGADVIALDATDRARPPGEELERIFEMIRELGLSVLADISTVAEGRRAVELGAAFVATTLAGHTEATKGLDLPAIGLVRELCEALTVPVLAEGGIVSPADARRAFRAGAHGVVIGSAITQPQFITRRFVDFTQGSMPGTRPEAAKQRFNADRGHDANHDWMDEERDPSDGNAF